MVWQATDHDSPNCGGQLHGDPIRDVLTYEDCRYGYTEASIREWENGGPAPEPISRPMDRE